MISKLNRLWTTLVFPHIESNHRALTACLVALLTFCGVSFFAVAKGAVAPSSVASAPYLTAPVLVGNVTSSLNVTGTLQAVVTAKVGSQLSGQIDQLLVDFNDHVKRDKSWLGSTRGCTSRGFVRPKQRWRLQSQDSNGQSRSNQICNGHRSSTRCNGRRHCPREQHPSKSRELKDYAGSQARPQRTRCTEPIANPGSDSRPRGDRFGFTGRRV